jgi:hypothetical protein
MIGITRRQFMTGALGAIALGGLSGCSRTEAKAPANLWVVAIDRSGSALSPKRLEQQLTQLDLVAALAMSRRSALDVWAFDSDAVRLCGPSRKLHNLDSAKQALLEDARKGRPGTLPGKLLERLASDRALADSVAGGGSLNLVVLTDGGIDDVNDRKRLAKACAAFAKRYPNAKVRVCGVLPKLRAPWDDAGAAFRDYRSASEIDANSTIKELADSSR